MQGALASLPPHSTTLPRISKTPRPSSIPTTHPINIVGEKAADMRHELLAIFNAFRLLG
jgi:hypothetical protein